MTRQIPRGDKGLICPFHSRDMEEVCHTCPLWIQIRGKNPQSMEEVDKWGCAMSWLPLLLVETSQQVRQNAAATEGARNAIARLAFQQAPAPILIEAHDAI